MKPYLDSLKRRVRPWRQYYHSLPPFYQRLLMLELLGLVAIVVATYFLLAA